MVVKNVNRKILDKMGNALVKPTADQTLIMKKVTANTTAQTIHTVTTGKTFYLMGISFNIDPTGARRWILSFDSGTTDHLLISALREETGQVSRDLVETGFPMTSAASAATIKVRCDVTNTDVHLTIWGWEE